jgi:hypothetical protein
MLSYYVVYDKKAGSAPPGGIIVLETRSGDALIWNHQSKAWQYDPQTAQRFIFDDQNLDRLEVVDRDTAQLATIQVTGREPLPDEDTIAWIFQWKGSPPQEADQT